MTIPPQYAAAESRLNAALSSLLDTARARQETFLANHGRYWQGLWSHLAVPIETDAVAPTNTAAKPTDQTAHPSWSGVAILPATMTYRVRIDVYDGPLGKGWTGTVEVVLPDGRVYTRTANTGPETWRARAWGLAAPA